MNELTDEQIKETLIAAGHVTQWPSGDIHPAAYAGARAIIAADRALRQAGQELYGWQVAGTRSLHTGAFAEADAKAEAARIGWMGQAFPLYTAPQPVAQAEPEPAAKAGDTLEDNVRCMLDKCPYTVRDMSGERTGKRWVEDLTGSLVLTFLGMQSRLAAPPPAQDHIGDAAGKVAPPAAQVPEASTTQLMADEYAAWIAFHHAGNGDFSDFLKTVVHPE